jgi:hypothetical protein
MLKPSCLLCIILLSLIGCATTPRQALNLPNNSTVGIINLIDNEATHTHIGTTVFNNFEEKYPVSWDFPQKIEKELINKVRSSTGYNVIVIQPSKTISENESELIDMTWNLKINSELIPEIKNVMQQNKVDVLLIIRDFKGEDYFTGTGKYLKNYGLFTRSFLGLKSSYAYAYSNILGFCGDPPKYVGGAWLNEHALLKDFKLPSNLKALDIEKLNSIAPLVTNKIPEFAAEALDRTGLKPIEIEKK